MNSLCKHPNVHLSTIFNIANFAADIFACHHDGTKQILKLRSFFKDAKHIFWNEYFQF